MNINKIAKLLAPFAIVAIVVVFVYNVVSNGRIQHPGKSAYTSKCSQCHGNSGEGIKSLVPPLTDPDLAKQKFDSIPCWIVNGINHPITVNGVVYDQPMYPIQLNEIQIANLMNFIAQEFLNSEQQTNARKVEETLKACK